MQILHGDNQVASRDFFLSLQKDKAQVSVTNLEDLAISTDLFGQTPTFTIEGLFSRRPSNEKKSFVDHLLHHPDLDVIIWESKDVSSQLKSFPPQISKKFDLPKHIFTFLDKPSINTFHLALKTTPPEMLFASLVTRFYKQANIPALQSLLKLDYAQKTSQSPYDLKTALELWLVKTLR